jgi:hypothetical protein
VATKAQLERPAFRTGLPVLSIRNFFTEEIKLDPFFDSEDDFPDLLKDHVAWLKWFLAETEEEEKERSAWWISQPRKEEEPALEWDRTWIDLRLSVWDLRLFQLKQTVRRANLDSKGLDIIASKEYRDTLAFFEEQERTLRESLEKINARLAESKAVAQASPKSKMPPQLQYSRRSFSLTTVGKWLSVNASDEKTYRERAKDFLDRYRNLLQQVGPKSYRVSFSILRDIWEKEGFIPIERPRFEKD